MTDLSNMETLKKECPREGCPGRIEMTQMQGLPVVQCPNDDLNDAYIIGMTVIPEDVDCDLLKPIKETDEDSEL